MRVRPCGDVGVLVEPAAGEVPGAVDALAAVLALHAALEAAPPPGVTDLVPAAATLLVRLDPARTTPAAVAAAVASVRPGGVERPVTGEVVIPVRYDGVDLDEVGRLTGLGASGVVAAHTGQEWTVAFSGFAPGFGYLVGADERLHVPRRPTPRTRVPAGAVGLAGPYSGVYPRESPGGWQLVGRTSLATWDLQRDPPALLRPGIRVRFVADDAAGDAAPDGTPEPATAPAPAPTAAPAAPRPPAAAATLTVLAPGPLTTVQDLGRPGHAGIGVTRSGAADRAALRLANRLVANPEGAAALEVTYGGLAVRASADVVVALTGARCAATVEGRPLAADSVERLPAAATLTLAAPRCGLRSYLAVRGGIAVEEVLGSRATDVLSGLGPPALRAGSVLPVGAPPAGFPEVDTAPVPDPGSGELVLRAVLGPRQDWFAATAARLLATAAWEVTSEIDRVGMRLSGPALPRTRPGELPSEGVVRGALQVPTSGRPTLFLADHPVTGGYPVLAVVVDADVDAAAQARPGQQLRFRLVPSPLARR